MRAVRGRAVAMGRSIPIMGRHFLRLLRERIRGALDRKDLKAADRFLTDAEVLVTDGPSADGSVAPGPLAHDDEARESVRRLRLAIAEAREAERLVASPSPKARGSTAA